MYLKSLLAEGLSFYCLISTAVFIAKLSHFLCSLNGAAESRSACGSQDKGKKCPKFRTVLVGQSLPRVPFWQRTQTGKGFEKTNFLHTLKCELRQGAISLDFSSS